MSADGSPRRFPKFFKVYLPDDSGDDMAVPISFNKFLPKSSLPKKVIVRSIYGHTWKLELRKCCSDAQRFVLVDGWKKIVKDESLKGGEFLTFEFDGFRLFNFCIYGEATCKRLGTQVNNNEETEEEEDVNPPGGGGGTDNVIIIDSDDSDDDGSDDGSDDADFVGDDDDEDSEDVLVVDDGVNGDDDEPSKEVIVIDSGDDSDDEDDDVSEVETERKEKGSSSQVSSKKSDNEDDKQYLENDENPYFKVNLNVQRKTNLRIKANVINAYGLHFPEFIYLVDPLENKFGKLKRRVEDTTIKGFESIIRRNQVRANDKMICELEKEIDGLVRQIKVHVIRG